MDFVNKVTLFNKIAGNANQFSERKLGLYIGLIAEEFGELLESIPLPNGIENNDADQLRQMIDSLDVLSSKMKSGVYDHLIKNIDRVEAVDAHIDIAVVALGAAFVTGADVDGACHNVADSNLSKFPIVNGEHIVLKNTAGKVIKPDTYTPASIAQFLN